MTDKLVLNSAHAPGRTCIAFSRDGTIAYTGGCDSLVRVWKTERGTDQEPDTALDADDAISSIAVDNDGWIAGSEDSHVRRYLKESTDMESLVTRTHAVPVRCVAVDPKGRRLAVTSDEPTVKVIDLGDTTKMHILTGHTRGVRKATWHPSGSLLTTCGADGKIIVWDVSKEEPELEKVIEGVIPVIKDILSEEYTHDCSALWHPSGQYFMVPSRAHEIAIITRSDWSISSTLSDNGCTGAITAIACSVNGAYVASAHKSGIFIWSTSNRRVVVRRKDISATINQLAFSPTYNLLAWTDDEGIFSRCPDIIPSSLPSPIRPIVTAVATTVKRHGTPLFGFDDGADKRDDALGLVDGTADVDPDAEGQDDDWIIDDLGDGLNDKPEAERNRHGIREMVSVAKAQPPFQPGATPFEYKRRYLAFNNIGVIEVVDQDTHHIVNVEFHDQTTRKNYHFTDHHKFDFASIGERGIVYSCPPEHDHPAQITYKPYSTWASQGDWTYSLPKGERAIAVAAGGITPSRSLRARIDADVEGNGYVAVATDKGVIRFFSGGGIQRGPIWAIDGDVVAMVAGRDYVLVVHREGGTSIDGNQNLKYTLRTADTFRVMHTGRLPINKGETLKWMGITDEGAPVIYDSAERLMMLEHFRFTSQGSWVILCDTNTLNRRVGKDESYWPVGVSKSTFMCIILKGREEHPGFPRPLVQEIDMRMPYLDIDSPEAEKEERLARETILLDLIRDTLEDDVATTKDITKTEVDLDKELIQIIQLACKHDRLQRALDAAKLLHHTPSFDLALKVAEFYRLSGLHEKITFLKSEREDSDRLRGERDRRREWRQAAGVIPPSREPGMYWHNGTRPFQDEQPAPVVPRAGLTAATPLNEPSPFSRRPVINGAVPSEESISDTKRKRTEFDDIDISESLSSSSKRRNVEDDNSQTAVSKPNPFAKRTNGDNKTANPFLRKLASSKSIHKSESFFQKVDAAEAESEKTDKSNRGAAKAKTGWGPKQTTLFGFPHASSSKKRNGRATTEEPSHGDEETQIVSTDLTLADGEQSQETDETQKTLTESPAETEQTAPVEPDAVQEDDNEPIDWPPSPPAVFRELASTMS